MRGIITVGSALYRKSLAIQRLNSFLSPLKFFLRGRISHLKRAIVGKNVEALLVNSKQGLFLIAPEDLGVGGSLIENGAYCEDEIQRICSLANEDSSVLFVGTHIGALAIPVSKRVKQVTAIEANPDTFKLLTKNILLNNCENISAIQIAASDQKGELEFVVSKVNSGGSKRMPVIKASMYFYDKPNIVKVKADRLDNVVFGEFAVIVMDIEGSEYFALKGMGAILSTASHLIVEFLPHHLKNVSNVSVQEFLAPIDPYFDILNVPSKNLKVEKSQFTSVLESMYDRDECDDGIVFSKK
jgi:FkbM family methyltransferase